MEHLEPDLSEPARKLDVTVLHSVILERIFGITKENMANQTNLSYTKKIEEAISSVSKGESCCAFIMNPTRESRKVSESPDQAVDDIGQKTYGEAHHRTADQTGCDKDQETEPDLNDLRDRNVEERQHYIDGDQESADAEPLGAAQCFEL